MAERVGVVRLVLALEKVVKTVFDERAVEGDALATDTGKRDIFVADDFFTTQMTFHASLLLIGTMYEYLFRQRYIVSSEILQNTMPAVSLAEPWTGIM